MESADLAILAALQRDGRLTNAELAGKVGLSPSQCSRRRSSLEATGLIANYAAILDAAKLGLQLTAFVEVTLNAHSEERAKAFASFVGRMDAVQGAYALTGETDYLLKIVAPDLEGLSDILNRRLLAHESVARIRSSIVLERLKETTALPLGRV